MRELGDRVIEIVIRDSHVECVNIFSDFQKFRNLRHLTITRSNVKDLYDCAVTSSPGQIVVSDSETGGRQNPAAAIKIPADSLHSLEILDLSGNLLKRFAFINIWWACKIVCICEDKFLIENGKLCIISHLQYLF